MGVEDETQSEFEASTVEVISNVSGDTDKEEIEQEQDEQELDEEELDEEEERK